MDYGTSVHFLGGTFFMCHRTRTHIENGPRFHVTCMLLRKFLMTECMNYDE